MADHKPQDHGAILKIAFSFIAGISIIIFTLLFFGADRLSGWMGDANLSSLFRVGAFTVLLMPLLAVLKGYFQSSNHMEPVAYAQVSEQAIRVSVILIGTWVVVSSGMSLYTAGEMAMYGAVAGEVAGVALLVLYFRKHLFALKRPVAIKRWPIMKELMAVSLSVSMSSLILLLFQMVDSFTIFRILADSGMGRIEAMEQKGIYDRGQPLVQFGLLMATSLALAIVPLVARMANKTGGRSAKPYAQLAFRISFLFAFASAVGLTFVMPYVNETLFQNRDESLTLIIFSWQIIWMSLLLVITAMLHGLGKVRMPALILVGGLILKIMANVMLIPLWGVAGAAAAGNIGLAAIVAGLLLYFKGVWALELAPLRYYAWLFGAATAMAVVVFAWTMLADGLLFDGVSSRLAALLITVTAVPLGAAVFLASIARSRIITEKEWYIIPFGRRMAGLQLWINSKKKGDH